MILIVRPLNNPPVCFADIDHSASFVFSLQHRRLSARKAFLFFSLFTFLFSLYQSLPLNFEAESSDRSGETPFSSYSPNTTMSRIGLPSTDVPLSLRIVG